MAKILPNKLTFKKDRLAPALFAIAFVALGAYALVNFTHAATLDGDVNGDSSVNITDLSILLGSFGKTGTYGQGDLNGNGKVEVADLSVLLTNFGKSIAVSSPVTAPVTGPVTSPPKLKYAPPVMGDFIKDANGNNTTKHYAVVTKNLDARSETLTLDTSTDYYLNLPKATKGSIEIVGGHNIIMIGGSLASKPADGKDFTIWIHGQTTGTVHIEGVLIDNRDSPPSDAIDGTFPGILQLQNSRIINVWGQGNVHGDILQMYGNESGKLRILVDRLTGSSAFQGLFLRPDSFHSYYPDPPLTPLYYQKEISLSNVDLNYNNKAQDPRSENSGGTLLWLADSAGHAPIDCRAADSMSFSNVFIGRTNGTVTRANSVWPRPDNANCPMIVTGTSATWNKLLAHDGKPGIFTPVNGFVTLAPAPSEFVPDGAAGINYSSPGYLSP